MINKTPLYDIHVSSGGKMVDYAGYKLPVEFSKGVIAEHIAVREKAGIFDVSHMGEIIVTGKRAIDFLQYYTVNDVSKLTPGQIQYSCFPNEQGGIVDDLLVYCLEHNTYLLVVNASNTDKVYEWLKLNKYEGVSIENKSGEFAQIALQGPKAVDLLNKLSSTDLHKVKFYTFIHGELAGIKNILISATGYTGAGGFELYLPKGDSPKLWHAISEAGKEYGLENCGLASRDTLRLEKGYCLYGNEINDETSPIEAGLSWIVKLNKGEFLSADLYRQQKEQGTKQILRGFILQGRGIPRHGYSICKKDGTKIGYVTSGTMSPVLKKGIGMGYILSEHADVGNIVCIEIRNKLIEAEIVKLPFV